MVAMIMRLLQDGGGVQLGSSYSGIKAISGARRDLASC